MRLTSKRWGHRQALRQPAGGLHLITCRLPGTIMRRVGLGSAPARLTAQGAMMILEQSLEHLYAIELPTPFPVGPVTVYLADAPGEPLTLIDTGPQTAESRAKLEAGLAYLGHAPA